jgi:ankyrin repeat protein
MDSFSTALSLQPQENLTQDEIRELSENGRKLARSVFFRNADEVTALLEACNCGQLKLDINAPAPIVGDDFQPALHHAAGSRNTRGVGEIIRLLVELGGASVNVLHNGDTPLDVAVQNMHIDICEVLNDLGGKIHGRTYVQLDHSFELACNRGDDLLKYKKLKDFVKKIELIDETSSIERGTLALNEHYLKAAINSGELGTVKALIDAHRRGQFRLDDHSTALHVAVSHQEHRIDILKLLVNEEVIDINVLHNGETPADLAGRLIQVDEYEVLYKRGGKIHRSTPGIVRSAIGCGMRLCWEPLDENYCETDYRRRYRHFPHLVRLIEMVEKSEFID